MPCGLSVIRARSAREFRARLVVNHMGDTFRVLINYLDALLDEYHCQSSLADAHDGDSKICTQEHRGFIVNLDPSRCSGLTRFIINEFGAR